MLEKWVRVGKQVRWLRECHPPAIVFVAIVSLTSVLGYRFYNEPRLDIGTTAPQTIRAPEDAAVEDEKATEEQRKEARSGSIPVLQIDFAANQQMQNDLQQRLKWGTDLRQKAGVFPFVSTAILSNTAQLTLRRLNQPSWERLQRFLLQPGEQFTAGARELTFDQFLQGSTFPLNLTERRAIEELQSYQRGASQQELERVLRSLTQARQKYEAALLDLNNPPLPELENLYAPGLLDLPEPVWQKTQLQVLSLLEQIQAQGVAPGFPPDLLQRAIALQVRQNAPGVTQSLVEALLVQVVKPNLTKDLEQTRSRAEQAARKVPPVRVTVQRNMVIVQQGETITQEDFVLLDHFGLSRRGVGWLSLTGFGLLVGASIGVFWFIKQHYKIDLRKRDYHLILWLSLTAPFPLILGIPATSLPAIGLLVGSFYGSGLGITVVGLLTVLLSTSTELGMSYLVANAIGGLLAGWWVGRLRSREELAFLGWGVGLTQGIVYLLLNLVIGPAWYVILGAAASQALIGLAWSVVTLGVSPYLEHLFDLITPIRLAELANPNRPLLKRLAAEAPGTFQHTLMVATLAEAAAKALHCNVELVRAGTLYHDIGKMHDPLSFIENQMGLPNKHDTLNDPWKSAEIIKKHVSEGLVLARRCRLPTAIQEFIPEHQGTMLIAYFYHQAQQEAQTNPDREVREQDFRYDGPVPQSRETGIVMLADSCEAALRSLKEACADEALAMVNRILRARWQDNQLKDSGLTRQELSQIAEIFVQVWKQCNHQRIAYPKPLSSPVR
ncbi:MAG: HDIG domain-containing protein [Leptolyngbyaceae cyanobacterium bins.59]|nr:HDIG domain-containing protein [Leptolyngbyaceae cyanobacterium bins.59]